MAKYLILGCGWVGQELTSFLVNKGHEVHCTTTTKSKILKLTNLGAKAFHVDFDQETFIQNLDSEYDYILTSVPASSKSDDQTTRKRFQNIGQFLNNMSFKKHIYLSSTGIYPDIDFVFDESYMGEFTHRLALAEQIMQNVPHTIVYRLGGLFGRNRIFAKYFSNRIYTNGDQLANFVHLDDVVALIELGFTALEPAGIYNVVAPEHPTKKEVILASAKKYNFDLPSGFEPSGSFQKMVKADKIVHDLSYQFKYSNPLYF